MHACPHGISLSWKQFQVYICIALTAESLDVVDADLPFLACKSLFWREDVGFGPKSFPPR